MPEGPEIRRAADRIEAVIRGQKVEAIFFAFERLQEYREELEGRVVTRLETRGKALLTWFDDEVAVYSHNQLYGRWFVRRREGFPRTSRQLRFAIHTARGSAFLYSASDLAVLRRENVEEHPFLRRLGPDPLDRRTTASAIRKRLESRSFRRRRFGSLLLDQSFLAGLGNYLRSEVLYVAGVHPNDRPVDLDVERLRQISRAINTVVRRAYRTGGLTSDSGRVAALRKLGRPRSAFRHYVFGQIGKPCPRCGDPIAKLEVAGRRLYLCSECQPITGSHRT